MNETDKKIEEIIDSLDKEEILLLKTKLNETKDDLSTKKISDLPAWSEEYHKRIEGQDFYARLAGKPSAQILKEQGIEIHPNHALKEGQPTVIVGRGSRYLG